MNIVEIINKKKENIELTKEEIDFVINAFNDGNINNKKIIQFMSVINENNFSFKETYYLANAIANTGKKLEINKEFDVVVDKHSAGLISDVSTLIFVSVLSALDVKSIKVISNGYGNFSNTYEKLHAIKGFNTKISREKLVENMKKQNIGFIDTPSGFADVDHKLYNLRVKNKIVNIPIIAASILSKMLGAGANVFIFDVKNGEGSIGDKNEGFSTKLAEYLVSASKLANISAASVVTNLDQPISSSIGNHVELLEAINVLDNQKSAYNSKLLTISKELTVEALILSKKASGRIEAEKMFDEAISSKRALDKFKELVKTYGGEYESLFAHSTILDGVTTSYLTSNDSGYIENIQFDRIKDALSLLSFKNEKAHDSVAGIEILKREGDSVSFSDKLVRITYSIDNKNFFKAKSLLYDAYFFTNTKPKKKKLFYKVII